MFSSWSLPVSLHEEGLSLLSLLVCRLVHFRSTRRLHLSHSINVHHDCLERSPGQHHVLLACLLLPFHVTRTFIPPSSSMYANYTTYDVAFPCSTLANRPSLFRGSPNLPFVISFPTFPSPSLFDVHRAPPPRFVSLTFPFVRLPLFLRFGEPQVLCLQLPNLTFHVPCSSHLPCQLRTFAFHPYSLPNLELRITCHYSRAC